jgi:multidrug efflux system membrane fusion protein
MKANFTNARYMRTVWTGILFLLLALILALQSCGKDPEASSGREGGGKGGGRGKRGDGGGPAPVVVTQVVQKDVPVEILGVGSVEAYSTITVKAQVGGLLTEVHFHEGDYVKKGEKLFTIDPRQIQAMLAQAEANLLRDQALLSQSQANLARDMANQQYAAGEADRYAQLVVQGIVSKEQGAQLRSAADASTQSVQADKAAIESARAQIGADRANIDNVKVQLGYTTITSPIEGRTGNMTVKQGNVVTANTTDLITINQVVPIYVTFAVPEARLGDVKKYMALGTLQVAASPQDGSGGSERGQLTFVDNNVDIATGTIKLKGTFQNADLKLWPGQFVNVVLRLSTQSNALLVPNQVVQTSQDGQFVYLVREDHTVEMRFVTVGTRVDQDMVIEKGLTRGDTVVVDGQLRLAPGSRIQERGAGDGGPGRGGTGGAAGDAPAGDNPRTPGGVPRGDGRARGKRPPPTS